MSSVVFWILVASVIVALIIMVVAFVIMRAKINNVKQEYQLTKEESPDNPAVNREDHGILLWEEKKKTKNPLSDLNMEFAINTAIRNGYKTFMTFNFDEEYESKTLTQAAKMKKSDKKYEFALVNFNDELIDNIDSIIKESADKSLIMIVNTNRQKKLKEFKSYLKLTGVRNEEHKIDSGNILIAK